MLLVLHGTGGDENSLLPLADAVDREAAVLSVRGNVREGSANRFFRRVAEGVFDVEDLKSRTQELADFVLAQTQVRGIGSNAIVALGYSNGANIAASLLLLRPEVLAGAILIRAMVPLEPPTEPILTDKQVLLLSGDSDPIVDSENPKRLAAMLSNCGATVQFELLNAGHELTRLDVEISQQWTRVAFSR